MKTCTLLLLAVTLVGMVVGDVICVCCFAHWHGVGRRCNDCTAATPYCAYGNCNFYSCRCFGGCREGSCSRRKRSLPELPVNPEEIFSMIDVNGDSVLDKEEFDQRAKAVTISPQLTKGLSEEEFLMMEFEKMDTNRDGVISKGEFDNDLM